MNEQNQIPRVSSIEWVAVSKYLHWLEVQSELLPFSISGVWSFRVGPGGFEALARQKGRLHNLLEGNLLNLQSWVKAHQYEMTETERVFARSLWKTTKMHMEIVAEHRDRALALNKATATFEQFQDDLEECDDDLPF